MEDHFFSAALAGGANRRKGHAVKDRAILTEYFSVESNLCFIAFALIG